MAAYEKYNHWIEAQWNREIDNFGGDDTFRAVIHSDAPDAANDDELADLAQVSGGGYTAGGEDIQNDATRSGGVVTMTAADVVWTASSAWSAARYVSIYDDTSAGDILMCSYDYGANFTLAAGETFTLDFGAALHTAS
jgi:hypothetical protein